MFLRVSSFSPSTGRRYSPLVSAGGGFGLATPAIGASPSPSLAVGGPGEDPRDFRAGSSVTSTMNALQTNKARPGSYNSSAASSRAQTPYQGLKVLPFTRLDHKGQFGGLM